MKIWLVILVVGLGACTGGRETATGSARDLTAAGEGDDGLLAQTTDAGVQRELLNNPLAEALQPIGLGFRVTSVWGPADQHGQRQEFFGVTGLPLLIDVDADPTTGPAGADVAVRVYALAAAYALEVRRLAGAAEPLFLRIEAEFSDPLQQLGDAAGETLRMGYDSRQTGAPAQFNAALQLARVPDTLVPGARVATLEFTVEGGGAELTALGGSFAGPSEQPLDELRIAANMRPPPATTRVRTQYGGALPEEVFELATSSASRVDLSVENADPVQGLEWQTLLIDRMHGAMMLRLEEATGTQLTFESEHGAQRVEWASQRSGRQITASLAPLPLWLEACLSDGDQCGSNGSNTRSSLTVYANEVVALNYAAQRGDEQTLIENLQVQSLAVDFGSTSSFRRGYVFFDTDDQLFGGRVLRLDPDKVFDLRFPQGTLAQDRLIRWKNFVQIDQRRGSMVCPGGASLDIKVDGRFYDADFVVDRLC